MTGEERKVLRDSLISLGFERTWSSPDIKGSGVFSERWIRRQARDLSNIVTIEWGPRDRPKREASDG